MIGGLIAALWGRPAEAERWADAAERATLRRHAARRQRFDRLVAGPPACAALSARGREDAHRCGARGRDACPREPVPAERHWCCSRSRTGWPARSTRPTTCFADVAEEGLELGAPTPVTVALGERAAIAIERGAWVQAEELADRALRFIRRSRMEEYPTSALAYAVAARVALHRGDARGAEELLDAGAAPAAAAHVRAAAPRGPDPLGARTGLPGARRRGRRRDDAARDRRDPAPTTRPRGAPGPGGRAARQPEDDARAGPRAPRP